MSEYNEPDYDFLPDSIFDGKLVDKYKESIARLLRLAKQEISKVGGPYKDASLAETETVFNSIQQIITARAMEQKTEPIRRAIEAANATVHQYWKNHKAELDVMNNRSQTEADYDASSVRAKVYWIIHKYADAALSVASEPAWQTEENRKTTLADIRNVSKNSLAAQENEKGKK